MYQAIYRSILILLVLVLVGACSNRIYRVDEANYGWGTRENLTTEEVRPTIERTAASEGWTVSDAKPGSFSAWREWGGGKHDIAVDVTYTGQKFNIDYKSSKQMAYDGTTIHHSYNRFVKELEVAIQNEVAQMSKGADAAAAAPAPKCKDVGGYEAYLQQTGKTCEL